MFTRSLLVALALTSHAAAQCIPAWSDQFSTDGPPGRIFAITTFDPDGPGPQAPVVVIGGELPSIGGVPTNGVAAWDGTHWSALGAGLGSNVYCFTSFDFDGAGPTPPRLIAGGYLSSTSSAVAVWDGSAWSPLGSLLGNTFALVSYDDDGPGPNPPVLVAAGSYTSPSTNVAKWNGSTWVPMGGVFDSYCLTAAAVDFTGSGAQTLFVGGYFTAGPTGPLPYLARWDGAAWTAVPADNIVYSLAALDDDGPGPHHQALFVGGQFNTIGGVACNRIARYDGTAFTPLGNGINGTVQNIFAADVGAGSISIIAGGSVVSETAPYSLGITRFDGTSWVGMGQSFSGGTYGMTLWDDGAHGPRLIVAGDFDNASYLTQTPIITTPRIAQWTGSNFAPLGPSANRGLNNSASALAVWDDDGPGPHQPSLYIGGRFTAAGDLPCHYIARFDGRGFSSLGAGLNSDVYAMVPFDDDGPGPHPEALYVGGGFSGSGTTIAARGIGRWNGSTWSALGTGVTSPAGYATVQALCVFDDDGPSGPHLPALIAAGDFTVAGGVTCNRIARWNGSAWSPVGAGFNNGYVNALAVYDPDGDGPLPASLYAGGTFSVSGTTGVNNIARWDGAAWQSVAGGVGGTVNALCVFDDDGPGPHLPYLYVAGAFSSVGAGINSRQIARFNGTVWSAVPSGFGGGGGTVNTLTVADAGDGAPALYVSGQSFSNQYVSGTGRFNGTAWTTVNWAGSFGANALIQYDDDGPGPHAPGLYAAGRFTRAGPNVSSEHLARYGCAAPACYANCDRSTGSPVLNINDFICFLNKFAAGDPYANCDGSTTPPILNILDFACFLNQFAAGCP